VSTSMGNLSPSWIRILPFAAYLGFLGLMSGVEWAGARFPGAETWVQAVTLWHYPIKTAVVIALLVLLWPRYDELQGPVVKSSHELGLSAAIGVAVYLAWVRMDWPWAMQGTAIGYNPFQNGVVLGTGLAAVRLLGASLVVPVMEEIFWRSFLLRYLINPRFEVVPLGTFTPASLAVTVVLFGLEHQLWLAGMMAGLAYSVLCYRTRRLWPCIVAHGVTNLCLGIHVLVTGEWHWW